MKEAVILLQPFLDAVVRLQPPYYTKLPERLQTLFKIAGERRPDLVERTRFATLGRNSLEIEKILLEALSLLRQLERAGELPAYLQVPDIDNYRFNHTTGRIHVGTSHCNALLFPDKRAS